MEGRLKSQREFFLTNKTKDYQFRKYQLLKLKHLLKKYEADLLDALYKDLNKSIFEAYISELSLVYHELNYQLKNLRKNMKGHKVKSPFFTYKSTSFYQYEPYGQVLIIAPFNYPVQLVLTPLIGALATGNVVTLKMSKESKYTSEVLSEMLSDNFDSKYINIIDYDYPTEKVDKILEYNFDLIMFTGSTKVGKIVHQKAALNLTPTILELGGKSPCIVDYGADIKSAAQKIIWGKLMNAGQTCIAPDYVLVDYRIKQELIENLKQQIVKQYSSDVFTNDSYPKIINRKAFNRLVSLIDEDKIYYGGDVDEENLKIEPTIILENNYHTKIMEDEIFGPLLPILEYNDFDLEIARLNRKDKPLALYYFGNDKSNIDKVINNTSSGGVVINDVLLHVSNINLPFGGVGKSGMSSYHGRYSFINFSHSKAVVKKSKLFNISLRYAPFIKKITLIKKIM